jgi:hypothetical protein
MHLGAGYTPYSEPKSVVRTVIVSLFDSMGNLRISAPTHGSKQVEWNLCPQRSLISSTSIVESIHRGKWITLVRVPCCHLC